MKLSSTSHGIVAMRTVKYETEFTSPGMVAMWTVKYETESNQSWDSNNAEGEI